MLARFDAGWCALPQSIRDGWTSWGIAPRYPLTRWGGEKWNGWADVVRKASRSYINRVDELTLGGRSQWKMYFGETRAYALPDIVPAVDPSARHYGDDLDMKLILDAFYSMRVWGAVHEFEARWNNVEERRRLWNEIVEHWRIAECYPVPPIL